MIDPKCRTKEWLDACREQGGRMDPGLLEKSIVAFDLVGRLAAEGLPFVFKGGTSILLLLDTFRRLSIDVDIACPLPQSEVAPVVEDAVRKGPFVSMKLDQRDSNRLPKRHHYAVYYDSVVDTRKPLSIQLDVLEDEAHYPTVEQRPIRSRFVEPLEAITIAVPSVEGLLADKVTAFAPSTVGVPFAAYKANIKIAKHAADIGELFQHARKGHDLHRAYRSLFKAENGYRNHAFTMEQALQDTIQAARMMAGIQLRGYQANPQSQLLADGVSLVDTHMIGPRYALDQAKVATARAARLADGILQDNLPEDLSDLRFTAEAFERIKAQELHGDLARLNRLRHVNPESFFHWCHIKNY